MAGLHPLKDLLHLAISYKEWNEMRFSKGTLHYMKKNAKSYKPFTLNIHVKKRLDMWSKLL
jgi:CRISPR-associated protein Cas1